MWNSNFNLDQAKLKQVEREIEMIKRVNSEYTVKFFGAWIEVDLMKFACFLMELCPGNFQTQLNNKPLVFREDSDNLMNCLEFFISCELFRELTECLNYLHSLTPLPVIHRDLKPFNILTTNGENRRFLKLCGFGLAKSYEFSTNNTQDVGTDMFMAPEVRSGSHYNLKADIHSLAVIGLMIFGLENRDK